MKSEDYTHRIGRTGRAGRDGLAVTFAEFRDRFKIFDIEHFTKQPIGVEVIPGLEPQQRAPRAPQRFEGQGRGRPAPGPRGGGGGGARRPADYARKTGFNEYGPGDRGGPRRESTPWEKPAQGFAKPARPGGGAPGGKVFVPRDAKKRAYKPAD
jgi:hypothetical protein